MAAIKISDLNPAGSSFFSDSETFLNDLGDEEVRGVQGGSSPACIAFTVIVSFVAISAALQGYDAGRNARYARR